MSTSVASWPGYSAALADDLISRGRITTPEWEAAVRATPRHVFVPTFYEQDRTGRWVAYSGDQHWDRVYSNTGLYTKIGVDPSSGALSGVSSTSTPGLMTRMLETLAVAPTDRVLEIGTGTGYNAALLCHQIGDTRLTSIDVDAELVEAARIPLAELGYCPTLLAGDGADGAEVNAPYDHILATCSVPYIPPAWCVQLTPQGSVLADLKRGATAGNLIHLHHDSGVLTGRFDPRWAGFMPLQSPGVPSPAANRTETTPGQSRISQIGWLCPWENTVLWFLASLHMPAGVTYGYRLHRTGTRSGLTLDTPDGSWAELETASSPGHYRVTEGGPRSLWGAVETAHQLYHDTGMPEWSRFGMTVTPHHQWVWLDRPDGDHTWYLT